MSKKKIVFLCCAFVVLLVVGMYLTDIVLAVFLPTSAEIPERIVPGVLRKAKNSRYNIDAVIEGAPPLNTMEITGWAYIQTQKENREKQVDFIFEHENGMIGYKICNVGLVNRPDLLEAFPNELVAVAKSGVFTQFSPVKFANGIYQLKLYVYENETDNGLLDTNIYFEKKDREFHKLEEYVKWSPVASITPSGEVAVNAESYVDKMQHQDDDLVSIIGWAFLEDVAAEDTQWICQENETPKFR